MALQLIITLSSAGLTLLMGAVVALIGYIGKNQIKRLDKHEDILNSDYRQISSDITKIKSDVAAIKAVVKGGLE